MTKENTKQEFRLKYIDATRTHFIEEINQT